eukprot:1194353-Prorocentrum_minimum.AAC.2
MAAVATAGSLRLNMADRISTDPATFRRALPPSDESDASFSCACSPTADASTLFSTVLRFPHGIPPAATPLGEDVEGSSWVSSPPPPGAVDGRRSCSCVEGGRSTTAAPSSPSAPGDPPSPPPAAAE